MQACIFTKALAQGFILYFLSSKVQNSEQLVSSSHQI